MLNLREEDRKIVDILINLAFRFFVFIGVFIFASEHLDAYAS